MMIRRSARKFAAVTAVCLASALTLAACGGDDGGGGSSGGGGDKDPLATVDPQSLVPEGIIGKGPNGEAPASADEVTLTPEQIAEAKKKKFTFAVVMQTMDLDWSKLQVQGVTDTVKKYGGEVLGVTDGEFKPEKQISDIENMIQRKPDAMITIPVDNTATAPAYKKVSDAGIKVVYMLQNPRNTKPDADYVTIVSQDMTGSAYGAAAALAKYIPEGGTMGILTFAVDFFTTNVRTQGVKEWLKENRPDIKVKTAEFIDPGETERVAGDFLTANPDVEGLYSDWVEPGMNALSAMRATGKVIPQSTFDLGEEGALEMAKGGSIKFLAGQDAYQQGVVEATAAIKALLGDKVPPWIVLPALPVVQNNLLESYRKVWKKPPPANLVAACEKSGGCDKPAS